MITHIEIFIIFTIYFLHLQTENIIFFVGFRIRVLNISLCTRRMKFERFSNKETDSTWHVDDIYYNMSFLLKAM